jgi:branched-subunit amino acid transport protein AzlD
VGTLTLHTLSIIISGAAAAFACAIAVFLIFKHATQFSAAAEQKQYVPMSMIQVLLLICVKNIRILTIVPPFALVSLLCAWLNGSPEPYIVPALDVEEAFLMASFFLLMSSHLVPEGGDMEAFFNELEMIDKKGDLQGHGSLK